jgi:hypothetical protein
VIKIKFNVLGFGFDRSEHQIIKIFLMLLFDKVDEVSVSLRKKAIM